LLTWLARSQELTLLFGVGWAMSLAAISQFLGLSMEIGAFVAGVALASTPFRESLSARMVSLRDIMILFFFIQLGSSLTFDDAAEQLWPAIVLSLFVLIGNPIIVMIIMGVMGYPKKVSFKAGLAVAQISEFSFILVAMGVRAGLIAPSILSITALVGLVTITVSSYMILYNAPLYRLVKSTGILSLFGRPGAEEQPHESHQPQGHFIVVGLNSLGRELVALLRARGERVLAIDTDPHKLAGLDCDILLGDAGDPSVLAEAGLPAARMLVSALTIEDINDLLAYRCREAGIPCAINVMDLSATENLLAMETRFLLVPKVDGVAAQSRELKNLGLTMP
jgi:hypothetical protein